jgi:hypothetical protein
MRYYDIILTPPPPSSGVVTGSTGTEWTSFPNGQNDPGALDIELDLLSFPSATPAGNCTITIHGISLSDLQQAKQYANMQILVKGGMQAGLPFANPRQAGVLLQGKIQQSFGNWVGTDMNLNFVIVPSAYTYANPGNFVLSWLPGQSLALVLQNTLEVAYPNSQITVQIGNQYATSAPILSYYHTLSQLAQWLSSFTKSTSPTGSGVQIYTAGDGSVFVYDGSTQLAVTQLVFTDFIGQPKWVDIAVMQFTTVMRADIQINSVVKMPVGLQGVPGIVQTQAASQPSQLKQQASFQGAFTITAVRHLGRFRSPDGAEWVSIFQAVPQSVG